MPIVLDGPSTQIPPGAAGAFAIDQLYRYILPSVKSAAFALVDMAVLEAADQMCRRTSIWKALLGPVAAVVDLTDPDNPIGQSDYALPVYNDSDFYRLDGWALNGVTGTVLNDGQAVGNALEPNYYGFDPGCNPSPAAYVPLEGLVRIVPAPTDPAITMMFQVSLTVTEGATTLPGVLAPYKRELAKGALEILFAMPEKDWSDLKQAALKGSQFSSEVGSLSIRAGRAFSTAPLRRKPRTY